MFKALLKSNVVIQAKVRRADGRVYDLGRVNGWFPWRAWRYRFLVWLDGRN